MSKNKRFVKLISVMLVCVMVMVMCMGAYGSKDYLNNGSNINYTNAQDDDFNENDYEYLTFSAPTQNSVEQNGNTMSSRNSEALTNQEIIDEAIEFVYTLNLTELGFAYLEEECILQLEGYKEEDVKLESYSVLMPKNSTGLYYGSSAGTDYYYKYISEVDFDKTTKGKIKSTSNVADWQAWVSGAINVLVSFADSSISLPFSLISAVMGIVDNSEINYGAYNEYVTTYNDVKTKIIYRGSPTFVGAISLRAQKGRVQSELYFCPVIIDQTKNVLIKELYNGYIDLTETFTKEYLLGYFAYTNITGEIMDLPLASIPPSENWGR